MESEDTGTDVSNITRHRTNSSLGHHLDVVNRMVARWRSRCDGELAGSDEFQSDSDYDEKDKDKSPNPNPIASSIKDSKKKPITDEMKVLQMEREALEKVFDEYIDPDENGDVNIDEWFLGIQKLNVQLSETQQRAVYNFMDKEESGFIEKHDFVMFATSRFDTEELQSLQAPILQSVRTQNLLHNHTPSNLMNANLSQDWDDYDTQLLEQEGASTMPGMVGALEGNQCDVSKEEQNSLQSMVHKLQNEIKILKVEKDGLQSLTDELLRKQAQMVKDIAQSNSMQSIITQLQNELEISKAEKDRLRNENNLLNDECKETKMELIDLKSKYNELKKKSPLDTTRYTEWSAEEVILWIVSLENERFKKYEATLKITFKEQEFVGQWLDDVQKSDVHDWGIKHFGDKTKLFQYIEEIRNQKQVSFEGNTAHF